MAINFFEYRELERLVYLNKIEDARVDLLQFTLSTFPKFQIKDFHRRFYHLLNLFAFGKIKKLIISLPPQHGKSEGSTRRLMAFLAGIRPDKKMALVCYSATKAQKFGREIMSIMREKEYCDIFPEVHYPKRGYSGVRSNTNEVRESINSSGSMKFVGVDGSLTGDTIDILFYDDLYKNWQEANSPVVQEHVLSWYFSVANTRLHNDSQQLMTFTRWSDNDLISYLIKSGSVETLGPGFEKSISQNSGEKFLFLNFPAIKIGAPNSLDGRKDGEALWPEKHSLDNLVAARNFDPDKFECLYQGNPVNKKGLMYRKFKTYNQLPCLKIIKNYTDTADTGKDYLCSVVYGLPLGNDDPHKYVLDVVYTQKPMEITEGLTIELLRRNKVALSRIESNNGGRGFARVVRAGGTGCDVQWFHQTANKESRIFSMSARVNFEIVFPDDWHIRWPEFYRDISNYRKEFRHNEFDDAPDVLTGIIESENQEGYVSETKESLNQLGIF